MPSPAAVDRTTAETNPRRWGQGSQHTKDHNARRLAHLKRSGVLPQNTTLLDMSAYLAGQRNDDVDIIEQPHQIETTSLLSPSPEGSSATPEQTTHTTPSHRQSAATKPLATRATTFSGLVARRAGNSPPPLPNAVRTNGATANQPSIKERVRSLRQSLMAGNTTNAADNEKLEQDRTYREVATSIDKRMQNMMGEEYAFKTDLDSFAEGLKIMDQLRAESRGEEWPGLEQKATGPAVSKPKMTKKNEDGVVTVRDRTDGGKYGLAE